MTRYHLRTQGVDREACWFVYDLRRREICPLLSSYADHLVGDDLEPITVGQAMGYLVTFVEAISRKSIDISSLDQDALREFRDEELERSLKRKSSRGSKEKAKTTVNAKLHRIYQWCHWLQETGRMKPILGPNGPVKSTLGFEARNSNDPSQARRWYPLCYRLKYDRSKHTISGFLPTGHDIDQIHAYFFENASSPYVAHRNALIVDLAECSGFRRGSIGSLTVDQFEGAPRKPIPGYSLVQPTRQKFGYRNVFPIPDFMIERVREFVEEHWRPLVKNKDVPAEIHQGRLFLSSRSGAPLRDRSITQLITPALRSVGAPKGSSLHAFRAKFTNDEVDHELEQRLARGTDTSTSSISEAVSEKLGHRNPLSIRPYVAYRQSQLGAKMRASRQTEIDRYRQEKLLLEAEVLNLRKRLENQKGK